MRNEKPASAVSQRPNAVKTDPFRPNFFYSKTDQMFSNNLKTASAGRPVLYHTFGKKIKVFPSLRPLTPAVTCPVAGPNN